MQDLTGKAWGRFQIIEERGRGGMAVVYKAYDGVLQRTVALKVLLPMLAANEEFNQRFRREAVTAANLRHPNIVVIYDIGSHHNFQYIVMEYLEGATLQQEIQQKGALPAAQVIAIVGQLAEALDFAHQQRLIHRDVKPANIIIDAHEHVTLTDFGLVKAAKGGKITGEGAAIGTLKYMSPEQAVGKDIDWRSDVYSLGVVVYEMLVGEAPFTGTTPYETLRNLIHEQPPPLSQRNPQVNPNVERAVLKALAKEPTRRYSTASDFAQMLTTVMDVGPAVDWRAHTDALKRKVVLLLTAPDGREYPVYQGRVTIGRDTMNDIVLPVQQISRHHARIRCGKTGYSIMDLGSTNGTSVNGLRIPARGSRPLEVGDVLTLGPLTLLVTMPTAGAQSESKTTSMDRKPG